MFSRRRKRKDGGAALVEFALMMPLLLLLLFGIVEFGWVLSENLDVRQGAREGARLTAVNLPTTGVKGTSNVVLGTEICSRMDLVGGDATITWESDPGQIGLPGEMEPGDGVRVTVTAPRTTLTGFLDFAFSAGFVNLVSSVEIRIEQEPDWVDGDFECPTGPFTALP